MLLLGLMLTPLTFAATVQVSVGELTSALQRVPDEPDAVRRLVLEEIQQQLQTAQLSLLEGDLIYTDTLTNIVVEDGCTNTTIQSMVTTIAIGRDTQLDFSLESLFDPVVVSLNLSATINARGRARQNYGIRLGSCVDLGSDSFDFTADGPLRLVLQVVLSLNPQWIDENTLKLQPSITVNGQLDDGSVDVDVEDSLLRNVIERFLQGEVDDLLSPGAIAEEIDSLQQSVQDQLTGALEQDGSDGSIVLELPGGSDAQIVALYELLTPLSRFPLTTGYLQDNRLSILAALMTDDDRLLSDLLGNAAECELSGVLQIPLSREAVFSDGAGACNVFEQPEVAGTYYDTPVCEVPFEFAPVSLTDFCAVALDKNRLGNGLSSVPPVGQWSWSPGNTFDFGVLSLNGLNQPFVQRSVYKEVTTASGECALEMRVYKSSPSAQGQIPLIALHGGSWQRRGSGFLGIEHMATHFTNEGYVVFAPFYRLIGDNDGPGACRRATLADILADVNDAFDWVKNYQQNFGATGQPVLFGQSAGGHLALSLAVSRPSETQAAVLFYAPTDFGDFANQVQNGQYVNAQGQRIIESVTDMSIDDIDLSSELISTNSFPARILEAPAGRPPVFMLHGKADSLLPARQSVRLCNALAGDIEGGPANLSGQAIRHSFVCDSRGSELHLIAEGEHTLDLCVSDSLCLAGSPASAQQTALVVDRMLTWIKSPTAVGGAEASASGTGVGSVSLWFLFALGIISVFVKETVRIVLKY